MQTISQTDPRQLPPTEVNKLSIRQANRLFRSIDESRLWPVCGRFNATERAIRRLRKARREGLEINPGLEYVLALDREISDIINDPKL